MHDSSGESARFGESTPSGGGAPSWRGRLATALPKPGSPETAFFRRWVSACAVGELIGMGTAAAVSATVSGMVGHPRSTPARLGILAVFTLVGAVNGGALAALQWQVMRARLPRLRLGEWAGVTMALTIAGWMVGTTSALVLFDGLPLSRDTLPSPMPSAATMLAVAAMAGAGAGWCFGAGQWFVLRRHAEHASSWVWIHVPAWTVAMVAISAAAALPRPAWSPWAIGLCGVGGGAVGGLLLGGTTGVVARRLRPWVDERRPSLEGNVAVVTGANSGLGEEIALGLARLGATVLLLCRRTAEGDRVRRHILASKPDATVAVVPCDLAEARSIRRAVEVLLRDWPRLDVLVHNAGATFPQRTLTGAGVEATLAVDVVGPFLLTLLLRERLEACGSRVIALTGISHRKGQVDLGDLRFAHRAYDWVEANSQAQRGRFLFMWELARRAPRLQTAAVHPGAVLTGAQRRLPKAVRLLVYTLARAAFVRAEVGAIPVVRLAVHPNLARLSGRFFDRCRTTADAPEPVQAAEFWEACERITGAQWVSVTDGEGVVPDRSDPTHTTWQPADEGTGAP